MENRFANFNKAKEEVKKSNSKVETTIEERKQTYSFTLLPSERQMLRELAAQSTIRASDSQLLGSLIREKYNEMKQ